MLFIRFSPFGKAKQIIHADVIVLCQHYQMFCRKRYHTIFILGICILGNVQHLGHLPLPQVTVFSKTSYIWKNQNLTLFYYAIQIKYKGRH